ncbi:unnamed protein product [Microthlaspi erraticum]|uniref:FBD domain-containing protein n=1 Tax=Microthlaspi erraticum TaxID=1685480 RepID=A0A6D2KRY8_9BRAS|nr:unnamed protein product [Microthlaspi erraticum]
MRIFSNKDEIHTLCFDDSVVVYQNEEEEKSGAERFLNFIVNTLPSSNSLTKIKKFSLRHQSRVPLENDFSRLVYGWIWNAMKQGGLLELHLECSRDQFDIDRVLLTSNTLVKLTLSGNYNFGEDVESLFFPALKSLSILSVSGLGFEEYSRLVNGCPVLEELFITEDDGGDDNDWPYVPSWSTSVESASIRRLVISNDLPYNDSSKEYYDETYFKAPSLVYLDYSSVVFEDYKVVDLVSLVEVKLDLRLWVSKKMFGDVTKLVAGISNVRTLHLSPDSLEVFHFCCKSMPVFNNLLSLSIQSSKEKSWQVMPLLLSSCPNLQTLALKGLLHRVTNKCGDACACIPTKKRCACIHKKKKRKTCCLWTCQVKVLEISEYGGSFQEL